MTIHLLPNPKRCRQIPSQFSWIDHRLVRHHYFERCSADSLALYLFLLTVADARGLSYYSHASLLKQLKFSTIRLTQARIELINEGLIAYQHPLYQILSIEDSLPVEQIPPAKSTRQFDGIKQLRAMLGENHD